MKFEIKIIIAFTAVMILILFYFNTVVISFFDYVRQDLISHTYEKRVPEKKFIEEKIGEYIRDVLLWEVLLTLSMTLILYKLILHLTNREREYSQFLEIILLTISHNLGNFLAAQRGNIEILKLRWDDRAIRRLEDSYNYLKEDFKRVTDTISRFKSFPTEREKINLKKIIERTLSLLDFRGRLKTSLKDVYLYSNKQIVDSIVFALLENAAKYSNEFINVRLTKNYLAIRNDISKSEERGSGVGLKISELLSKKEGFKLMYRVKGDHFLALLKIR